MKKILMTFLLVFLSRAMKGLNPSQPSYWETTRLRASLLYLKSIETFRLLFISFLGMGMCLVLLMTSVILFHAALFLYTPWSPEVKMYIGFSLAAFYLLITIVVCSYLFSKDKWLKIFQAESLLDRLAGKSSVDNGPKNQEENESRESAA